MSTIDPSRQLPEVELRFGSTSAGRAVNVFCSDDTWWGDFEPSEEVREGRGAIPDRIRQYVYFCRDWSARTSRANDGETEDWPDADEFDAFSDLMRPGGWLVQAPEGETMPIDHAPVFYEDGTVSWRPAD